MCFSDFFFFHGKRLKSQLPTCSGSARSRTFQFYQLARRDLFQIIFDSILSCISIPAWNWPAHCHSLSLETTRFSASEAQVEELTGGITGTRTWLRGEKEGLGFSGCGSNKGAVWFSLDLRTARAARSDKLKYNTAEILHFPCLGHLFTSRHGQTSLLAVTFHGTAQIWKKGLWELQDFLGRMQYVGIWCSF